MDGRVNELVDGWADGRVSGCINEWVGEGIHG